MDLFVEIEKMVLNAFFFLPTYLQSVWLDWPRLKLWITKREHRYMRSNAFMYV